MLDEKISKVEFCERAITKLRTGKYLGIHSVFSGFNEAWRAYYGTDPVEGTNALVAAGKLVCIPSKKGCMLYLPNEAPRAAPKQVLQSILE